MTWLYLILIENGGKVNRIWMVHKEVRQRRGEAKEAQDDESADDDTGPCHRAA